MELKREQDEEINVYLAHLLFFLRDPVYQKWASGYVRQYETSVYDTALEKDRVHQYFTYKLNADYLLTSLGIFQNLGKPRGAFRRFYEQTPEIYIGRGKAYYDRAAEYHHQIYRQQTTLGKILHRLSLSFEEYVNVLSYMRSAYFDLIKRISEEDLASILKFTGTS